MWEVKVTQEHTSDYGNNLTEVPVFKVEDLAEANDVVNMFKKYGIGKISYSITQKQEEDKIWQHRF